MPQVIQMHIQVWEALLYSTWGLDEWADRWPKQRSGLEATETPGIWETRGLNVFSKCRYAKNWECDLCTLCNLSGASLPHLPGLRKDKEAETNVMYESPVVTEPALSPVCRPRERTFAVAWFHSNREGSAAFIGYVGDFQSKGLKLNVRGDKALSASNPALCPWLAANSHHDPRALAWVTKRDRAAP